MLSKEKSSTGTSVCRSPRKRAVSTQKGRSPKKSANKNKQQIPYHPSSNQSEPIIGDNEQLLQDWLHHTHHSYHLSFLEPTTAYDIRIALVNWYRANRRELPWRGDVGPYDGSTAGFVDKKKTAKKNVKANKSKDIRNFFNAIKVESEEEKKEEDLLPIKSDNVISGDINRREVSAYGVWVSEIMLQQTRVEAVIPYYLKWMQSFPTVESLANATPEQVNSHWAGLGFYRRARLLHQGAKRVVEEYGGVVPNTVENLMKVEGIGRYTASAIASIAYAVAVPVVDGNVCRVLSRLTGVANNIKANVFKDDLGWILAEKIVQAKPPAGKENDDTCEVIGTPGEVNQALMELGATYCSPSGSGIEVDDPLRQFYVSTRLGSAIGKSLKLKRNIASLTQRNGDDRCRLCDIDGVSSVFYDIADRINDSSETPTSNASDLSAIAGHAALPMPPPKKAKREEVLAVAVICLEHASSEDKQWLMIRRPSDGLLAGQWEFPSVCVWNSSQKESNAGKKIKAASGETSAVQVPIIEAAVRSAELNSFLDDITQSSGSIGSKQREQIEAPVSHVFSHVCHTMYVEKCTINEQNMNQKRWKTKDGREVGWFNEQEMNDNGITSGVRKLLVLSET